MGKGEKIQRDSLSSAMLSDKLAGCTAEDESTLLRGSASAVWLPRILSQLHSECQAPLNRAASRSSWRQEPTPAGTEAGSHRLGWPAACSDAPSTVRRAAREPRNAGGRRRLKPWKRNALETMGSGDPLSSTRRYISRLCFRHVLVLVSGEKGKGIYCSQPEPEISS